MVAVGSDALCGGGTASAAGMGHGRLDQRRGEFVVTDKGTVLYMVGRQDLSFLGDDLGCELAVGVLETLHCRDVREGPHGDKQKYEHRNRNRQQYPKPLYYLFSDIFSHIFLNFIQVLRSG